jgi:4,5-DOPA dioxygenase extradiol
MPERLPALFLGHGNPMNALARNSYTAAWARLGLEIPRPRAILCVSAHWYFSGSAVTVSTAPRTIHDFGGFPPELFAVQYPAPGDPELARRVQHLLAPVPVDLDTHWGLDHGSWSILKHLYPAADVPVVQLSMDARLSPAEHFAIGQRLAPLREECVLLLGSGNLVHNLRAYQWNGSAPAYDWALRFEQDARAALLAGDMQPFLDYERFGRDGQLANPTPEHFLPLLYILGSRQSDDALTFPVEGMEGGSVSMLGVEAGLTRPLP